MNKAILMGRLAREVETRYSGEMAIARYSLAVDRKFKREGEPTADFINCVAFGKNGEFAEKYLHKGMKIAVTGRIQTGNYKDKDGKTVYTTDIVVEEHEFCESKGNLSESKDNYVNAKADADGFMSIPDNVDDELPFN